VLSIGVPAAPKESKEDAPTPKAKVLSIGVPAAPKEEAKADKSQDLPAKEDVAAKAVATKAVDKTTTTKDGVDSNASSAPGSGRSSPSRAATKPTAKIDVVAAEQTADVDDETLKELYGKEHVNIVGTPY
jgi:peptide chain release factor subunit 3